jgi:hypothetical protein
MKLSEPEMLNKQVIITFISNRLTTMQYFDPRDQRMVRELKDRIEAVKKPDDGKIREHTTLPIPVQTDHGVIHIYYKIQQPIIGTMMYVSRYCVIVVTEKKKYCGFFSDNPVVTKQYAITKQSATAKYDNGKIALFETGICKNPEERLIKIPCEEQKPFKLHDSNSTKNNIQSNDSVIPMIEIDYVSYPILLRQYGGINCEYNTMREYVTQNGERINDLDFFPRFKLKVYEYDDFDQRNQTIVPEQFDNDPKLEYVLKLLWKMEQGIDPMPEELPGYKKEEEEEKGKGKGKN